MPGLDTFQPQLEVGIPSDMWVTLLFLFAMQLNLFVVTALLLMYQVLWYAKETCMVEKNVRRQLCQVMTGKAANGSFVGD